MQQHIKYYRIATLCEALNVSPSGYYAWLRRPINTCKLALKEAVNICYVIHQARVGAPSITVELKDQGFTMSMRTIGRVMQYLGLRAKSSRKFKCMTDSNHQFGASPNGLNRVFTSSKPNQVWVGDITYIRTDVPVKGIPIKLTH